jgi:cytochrome c-type biogenesis protein CcmE
MRKNTKVMLGGGLIFAVIMSLLMGAAPGTSGVEVTIGQLQADPAKYAQSNYVMVQGDIIGDSIEWDADNIQLRFSVKDDEGHVLQVVHAGVKPDNFTERIIAILEGSYGENGVFEAERVRTRCPSKYEARDPEAYDAEFHNSLQEQASRGE